MKRFLSILVAVSALTFVACSSIDGAVDSPSKGEQPEASTVSAEGKEPVAATPFGEVLDINGMQYTINEINAMDKVIDESGFGSYTADGTFMIVNLTFKNAGKERMGVSSTDFSLLLGDITYSTSGLFGVEDSLTSDSLNPGIQKTGTIFFDVPKDIVEDPDLLLRVGNGVLETSYGEMLLR